MAIVKVSELSSSSKESFEDAVRTGIERASKTLRGVKGAWVKEQEVVVENGAITEWRVNIKVSFLLDE